MKKLTSLAGRPFWIGLLTVSLTSAGLLPDTACAQQYQQTNLVSNTSQTGVVTVDPNLINPWGIARSSVGPWWGSDEGKGVATIFDGSGKPAPPVLVTIPSAGQAASGSPTGIVFNGSSDFAVETGKPAIFIFATFDGTIAGLEPPSKPNRCYPKGQSHAGFGTDRGNHRSV